MLNLETGLTESNGVSEGEVYGVRMGFVVGFGDCEDGECNGFRLVACVCRFWFVDPEVLALCNWRLNKA